MADRPRVLICANSTVRQELVTGEGVARLEKIADWEWLPSEGTCSDPNVWGGPSDDPADAERLRARLAKGDVDILLICHGSPFIDGTMLDAAGSIRMVGEMEGDRFANRVSLEDAAARGVRVVDATHGSSPPVAEWALGLMLNGLRNTGALFRRLLAGEEFRPSRGDLSFRRGELTERTVGIIGLGHIGRRLIELLAPFRCKILVHDPYVPKELALAVGAQLTSLERVMADSDVVVCLAPLTPKTRGMIGAAELALLRPDSVFVNASRGPIVVSEALIERARRGDIRVALDVFDPEPIPAASPIRELANVFLSPHIAGITAEWKPRSFGYMVDEIERFQAGHETMFDLTPRTQANRHGLAPVTG